MAVELLLSQAIKYFPEQFFIKTYFNLRPTSHQYTALEEKKMASVKPQHQDGKRKRLISINELLFILLHLGKKDCQHQSVINGKLWDKVSFVVVRSEALKHVVPITVVTMTSCFRMM